MAPKMTTSEQPGISSAKPSFELLEAVAQTQLAEMLSKDSGPTKPSQKAVELVAKMLALKAQQKAKTKD